VESLNPGVARKPKDERTVVYRNIEGSSDRRASSRPVGRITVKHNLYRWQLRGNKNAKIYELHLCRACIIIPSTYTLLDSLLRIFFERIIHTFSPVSSAQRTSYLIAFVMLKGMSALIFNMFQTLPANKSRQSSLECCDGSKHDKPLPLLKLLVYPVILSVANFSTSSQFNEHGSNSVGLERYQAN